MSVLDELDFMPRWEVDGSCVGRANLMYPRAADGGLDRARAICQACPVLDQCRDWVLALPPVLDPGGVVAGMTIAERELAYYDDLEGKRCATCGEVKPLHQFVPWVRGREARRPDCKTCANADAARRAASSKKGTT
ncbi:WhiB family transcriptional regulator [Nonomuraea sp. bgisy094]